MQIKFEKSFLLFHHHRLVHKKPTGPLHKVQALHHSRSLSRLISDLLGLMLSGCAIVEAVWEAFPAGRLRVADRGLREGLLLSMMYGPKKPKTRRRNRRGRRGTDNQAGSRKDTSDVG